MVDLSIGEKNVYKKRGQKEESRLVQRLPKRLSFVVDVSGSMAYFNRWVFIDLSFTAVRRSVPVPVSSQVPMLLICLSFLLVFFLFFFVLFFSRLLIIYQQ